MIINWQFLRTIILASFSSAWENRRSLVAIGLSIGVIDYISLMDLMPSYVVVLQFISFALVITLGVLIHRSLLLDDDKVNLQWGMREVRYLLVFTAMISSGFLITIFIQFFTINTLAAVLLPSEYGLPEDMSVAKYQAPESVKQQYHYLLLASGVIGLAGFSYFFSRFYLLLPAAATDQFLSLKEVWIKSKTEHLSMFIVIYIPILLLLPVSYGYQFTLLLPLFLFFQFILLVFIFTSITIAFHLMQQSMGKKNGG